MNTIYNYFADFFSSETQSNANTLEKLLPNHLQQYSILKKESQSVSKFSWEKDGEEVSQFVL